MSLGVSISACAASKKYGSCSRLYRLASRRGHAGVAGEIERALVGERPDRSMSAGASGPFLTRERRGLPAADQGELARGLGDAPALERDAAPSRNSFAASRGGSFSQRVIAR